MKHTQYITLTNKNHSQFTTVKNRLCTRGKSTVSVTSYEMLSILKTSPYVLT